MQSKSHTDQRPPLNNHLLFSLMVQERPSQCLNILDALHICALAQKPEAITRLVLKCLFYGDFEPAVCQYFNPFLVSHLKFSLTHQNILIHA